MIEKQGIEGTAVVRFVVDTTGRADLATFRALIAGADVFLHNLSPRAAQRLGIDAPTLHAASTGLVGSSSSKPASVAATASGALLPSRRMPSTVAFAGTRSAPSAGQSNTSR